MYKIIFLSFILGHLFASAQAIPILQEREWTSKDGRAIKATLIKADGDSITLQMSKDKKIHTLELDKFSGKDRLLVADGQKEAEDIIKTHNGGELSLEDLRTVYHFGMARELRAFEIKFTMDDFRVATNKASALILGSEGFVVKVQAKENWAFLESGDDLKVRPKVIDTNNRYRYDYDSRGGRSVNNDDPITAYVNGNTVRLQFPSGQSISEGEYGIQKCLIFSLDQVEPKHLN